MPNTENASVGKYQALPLLVVMAIIFFASPVYVALFGVLPESVSDAGPKIDGSARGGAWVLSMAAFLIAGISLGWVMQGRAAGLLIDRRNRYSLARFQIILWTLLVLPTIYTALMVNAIVDFGGEAAPIVLAIDWNLIALMGISIGSFVLSPLALSVKADRAASPKEAEAAGIKDARRQGAAGSFFSHEGQLVTRSASQYAVLSDLFRGEEVGNAENIDIARVQMLVLTLIIWLVYVVQTAAVMFASAERIGQLQPINEPLLVLILASHGGYLGGKLIPNSASARSSAARDLARANKIELRSAALIVKINDHLRVHLTNEEHAMPFNQLSAQIESVVSDVRTLNDKVAEGQVVGEELARLEGRMDAIEAAFGTARRFGEVVLSDEPHAQLVETVKRALVQTGHLNPTPTELTMWRAEDERALQAFITDEGVPMKAMPKPLVERLELAQGLLRAVLAE